jgi:hypothetical protein
MAQAVEHLPGEWGTSGSHLTCLGDRDQEDRGSRPAQAEGK